VCGQLFLLKDPGPHGLQLLAKTQLCHLLREVKSLEYRYRYEYMKIF
jgi:hypothetical protein